MKKALKQLALIAIPGALFLASWACNNNRTTQQEDSTALNSEGNMADSATAGSAGDYNETLTYNQYSFSVNSKGQGALRQLTITGRDSTHDFDAVNAPLEGDIYYASTADLNKDGKPEVYAFTRGTDSSGFSKVYAYAFDKQTGQQISFPELTPKESEEYTGHDSIYIEDQYVVRSFTVAGKQGNATEGNRKTIRYVLRPVENGFRLVQAQ